MFALLDAPDSPAAASAAFADDVYANVLTVTTPCFAVIKSVASVAAVPAETPALVKVSVKLALHAAQLVEQCKKHGSVLATFKLPAAFAIPFCARAPVARVVYAAVLVSMASCLAAIRASAITALELLGTPTAANVLTRLLLHAAQSVVHFEKHGSRLAMLTLPAVLVSPADESMLVAVAT